MKWSVATKIGTAFAVAVLVLALGGLVTYHTTERLIEAGNSVERGQQIIDVTQSLESLMADTQRAERSYLLTGEPAQLEAYSRSANAVQSGFTDARKLTQDVSELRRKFEILEAAAAKVADHSRLIIDTRRANGFDAALAIVRSGVEERLAEDSTRIIREIEGEEKELQRNLDIESTASAQTAVRTLVLGIILASFSLLAAGFAITRNISSPLKRITAAAESIAAGDLSTQVFADNRKDEVGALAVAIAKMVDNLRNSTRLTQEVASAIAAATIEILASVSQVAAGATETATAVNETATTVEEVKQTAHMATQRAKHVSDTAQKALTISRAGEKSVNQNIEGMDRIREQMQFIAESIVKLSEQSQTIGEIINSVNDLAEQSNLLAVNASIEAARAGDQGKGFAVVAQEVKILAEQSKQSTSQVRTILSDIQKATGGAVLAIEQGGKAVDAGVKQSTETGESIQALSKTVSDAAQAAIQIADSSQQQLIGVDQVTLAMENIKQASVLNVESMRQVEISAQNLNLLGQKLTQMIGQYRT